MRKLFTLLSVGALSAAVTVAAVPGGAADHLESPAVQADGRLDINDLYAFQSPSAPDRTVLIMTVNPVAGAVSPTTFHPNGWYDFLVDNDGDAVEDVRYSVRFGRPAPDGTQRLRVHGPGLVGRGETGEHVMLDGGGTAWAGLADDPFFFDLQAFRDQVKAAGGPRTFCDATPTDFFAGLNVNAIVIEVPSAQLGDDTIGVGAQTRVDDTVRDRMGRPAIATVLIPDGSEDAFNQTPPSQDVARWSGDVRAALLTLSGLDGTPYRAEQVAALTGILLPDVLTIDTSSSAGFLNGRRLADDVIDLELTIVTGGLFGGSPVLTSDCVGANDKAFSSTFPYLAAPHS
jgi:hypothetical protein